MDISGVWEALQAFYEAQRQKAAGAGISGLGMAGFGGLAPGLLGIGTLGTGLAGNARAMDRTSGAGRGNYASMVNAYKRTVANQSIGTSIREYKSRWRKKG